MKTLQVTFNQLIAGLVTILTMLIVTFMFFFKPNCDPQIAGFIQGILSAIGLKAAGYLWQSTSGSQAKDAATNDVNSQLIDALRGSAPIQQPVIPDPVVKAPDQPAMPVIEVK